jgi:hypothetical protein
VERDVRVAVHVTQRDDVLAPREHDDRRVRGPIASIADAGVGRRSVRARDGHAHREGEERRGCEGSSHPSIVTEMAPAARVARPVLGEERRERQMQMLPSPVK